MTFNFIMVTPAKDEHDYLPRVINSVITSSLKPKLWIIYDDGSIDDTYEIARIASEKHPYIRIFSNEVQGCDSGRDLKFRYSVVCKKLFRLATEIAENENIEWDYLILLDADTIVETEYFNCLLDTMEQDPAIGIASGDIAILKNDNEIKYISVFNDIPSGTARIWKKKCFIETGGYAVTQAPDTVSMVKAKLRGWKTVRSHQCTAYQLRDTSSAQGLWNGYKDRGKAAYYLGYNPILVLARGLSYSFQPRFYLFIPFLYAFIESTISKDERLNDEEVIKYYSYKRIAELLNQLQLNLRTFMRLKSK